MAKLTGVKVTDMTGGAITAIEYGGAVYAEVEVPRIGDICEIVKSWGTRGVGEFHNVFNISESLGNTYVHIEDGVNNRASGFKYYRKAETAAASAPFAEMVMAKVDAVERKVAAIEAKLAPAPAKPKTGDIVVITANTNKSVNEVGDIGKVEHAPPNGKYSVSVRVPGTTSTKVYTKYSEIRLATPAEIAKYEKAKASTLMPKNPALKVGDTVRVEGSSWFNDGTITKVIQLGGWNGDKPENILLEGGAFGLSVETKHVTKVIVEDVFTKAGREPNEYRKGDVVRYLGKSKNNGSIAIVTEGKRSNGGVQIAMQSGRSTEIPEELEIVCFAENRADLAKGAC